MSSFDEAMGMLCMGNAPYRMRGDSWDAISITHLEPYKIMRKYMEDEEITDLVNTLGEHYTCRTSVEKFMKAIKEILYTAEGEYEYNRINPEMRDELFEYMLGEKDRLHAPMFDVCTKAKSPILFRQNIARSFLTSFGYNGGGRKDKLIEIFLRDEEHDPGCIPVPRTPALPDGVYVENLWDYIEENNLGNEFSPVLLARLIPGDRKKDYILKLIEGDTDILGRKIAGLKYRWYSVLDILGELRFELSSHGSEFSSNEVEKIERLSAEFRDHIGFRTDGRAVKHFYVGAEEFVAAALTDEEIKERFISTLENIPVGAFENMTQGLLINRYYIGERFGERFLCRASFSNSKRDLREYTAFVVRRKTRRFIPQLKNATTPLAQADLEFLTKLQEKDAKLAVNASDTGRFSEVGKFTTVEAYVLIGLYYTMREVLSNAGAPEEYLLSLARTITKNVEAIDISFPGRVEDYIRSVLEQYRKEIEKYCR